MGIARSTLLREPGKITYGGANFFSKGNIVVTPVSERVMIESSIRGTLDATRPVDRMFRVTMQPVGEWENLGVLYGPLSKTFGASLIGDTDAPLVIHTLGGLKLTFANAAITRVPGLRMTVKETLLGEMEFTAILANEGAPATLADYYTLQTGQAYDGDTGIDGATIKTLSYAASWGESDGWAEFYTRNGWTITPEVSIEPEYVDGLGTIDYKVTNQKVRATGALMGPTLAEVWTALQHGTALGASRLAGGEDLVISATGVYVQLYNALLTEGPATFGQSPLVGDVTFEATRKWTANVPDPLIYIGTAAPE